MGRLLVVANRLPLDTIRKAGELHFRPSPGGLAVGLSSLPKSKERLWLGWPGVTNEKLKADEKHQIIDRLADEDCHPVENRGDVGRKENGCPPSLDDSREAAQKVPPEGRIQP